MISLSVAVLKLDQAGSHSLPMRSKGRARDDSDEAGIRACQACMDCLERYTCTVTVQGGGGGREGGGEGGAQVQVE